MDEEKASLLASEKFRSAMQEESAGSCGCSCPRLPAMCRRKKPEEKETFSSSLGVMLSMLGSVVGTGNIWRFPRIIASHADEGGALSFLMVWSFFLWMWSIPIILIEYGVGRYTKKTVIESIGTLIGPSYRFLGGFPFVVQFCIASYYSVILGWCGYYFIFTCANTLPTDFATSNSTFYELQESNWPIFCHGLAVLVAGLAVCFGVSTIEPVNNIIVPLLLLIVVFSFYWALYLPFASAGIVHMFHPSWTSLGNARLWLDALSQNAWDTGAGGCLFLTYATYMRRTHGAVKLGSITPIINNIVSLLCGILVFCTVFSVQQQKGYSKDYIVNLLKFNGLGNTGLTFIWMPILYNTIKGGRFLAAMFFLCLALAGVSSLISFLEFLIHSLADFGFRRVPATIIICVGVFLVGLGSAIDISILLNQDSVWGYALIISGCILVFLVLRYGVLRFREQLFNQFGIGDWPLPWVWVFVVVFIAPIEGVGLVVWYIVGEIKDNPGTWWQFSTQSLAMVLTQWSVALLVLIGLNWWMKPLQITAPENPRWRKILGAIFKLKERPFPMFKPAEPDTLQLSSKKPPSSYGADKEVESLYSSSGVVSDVEL